MSPHLKTNLKKKKKKNKEKKINMSLPKVQLDFIKEFTKRLIDHPLAKAFLRPVNAELDNAHDYHQIIKNPMDLGTIMKNIENSKYELVKNWQDDLKLVWENAKLYNNDKKNILHQAAEKLSKKCSNYLKNIPKTELENWSIKLNRLNMKLSKFLQKPPPEDSIIPRLPELELLND